MAKKIVKAEKKITLKKNKDEKQENGTQKGNEEGNENVTEIFKTEQNDEQIITENEGEIIVSPIEEPVEIQEPLVEEKPVVEEAPVVAPVTEKTWDWAAIDAAKEKAQALRKR
jgi:hypothetical protein